MSSQAQQNWKNLQKRAKKVKVHGSLAHRQAGGWVKGYWRLSSKNAHRNDPYTRNPRRNQLEIQQKGTRKEERMKKKQEKRLRTLKRKQARLAKKQQKNYKKQLSIQQSMQNIPKKNHR